MNQSRHRIGALAIAIVVVMTPRFASADSPPSETSLPAIEVPPSTTLVLEAPRPLVVSPRSNSASRAFGRRRFCTTPCTLRLVPGPAVFVVSGEGTREYHLLIDVPPAGARVSLPSPSSAAYGVGVALATIGSVLAAVACVVANGEVQAVSCGSVLPFLAGGAILADRAWIRTPVVAQPLVGPVAVARIGVAVAF